MSGVERIGGGEIYPFSLLRRVSHVQKGRLNE